MSRRFILLLQRAISFFNFHVVGGIDMTRMMHLPKSPTFYSVNVPTMRRRFKIRRTQSPNVQSFAVPKLRLISLHARARGSQVPNCRVYEFQSLKRPSQFQTLANFQCLMIRSCRISKCSKCSQSMQFKSSREWEFKFLRIRMNLSGVNRAPALYVYCFAISLFNFHAEGRKSICSAPLFYAGVYFPWTRYIEISVSIIHEVQYRVIQG